MKIGSIFKTLFTLLLTVSLFACKKDDNNSPAPGLSVSGVFVVNEGAFGSGNGSISYYDLETGSMNDNIFEAINGFPLGDVAQSMTIHQSKAYLVVNASKKIEVVDVTTFLSMATITGFEGPRYIITKGAKGYVSDWFSNEIKVVDLNSNTIVKSIATGTGPEQMLIKNNKLFVVNVVGWGNDSTVTVINTDTETAIGTIQVGLNPNSVRIDNNGKLWVLCGGSTGPDYIGGTSDDIAGSLWRINPESMAIELHLALNSYDHPSKLQTSSSGSDLYYLNGTDGYNGKIMKMSSNSTNAPVLPLTNKNFYGLGIDPVSGYVYGGFSPGFSQDGYIFRYTGNFILIDSIQAGIGPGQFVFN